MTVLLEELRQRSDDARRIAAAHDDEADRLEAARTHAIDRARLLRREAVDCAVAADALERIAERESVGPSPMHVEMTPPTGASVSTTVSVGFDGSAGAPLPGPHQAPTLDPFELLTDAWGVIANAYGGDWTRAPEEWIGAARRYHDNMAAVLSAARRA